MANKKATSGKPKSSVSILSLVKKASLRMHILAGFIFLILLIGSIAGISIYSLNQLEEENQQAIQMRMEQVLISNGLQDIIFDQMNNFKGYFLFDDPQLKQRYEAATKAFESQYYELLKNHKSEEEAHLLQRIKYNQDKFSGYATNAIMNWERGNVEDAMTRLKAEVEPAGISVVEAIDEYVGYTVAQNDNEALIIAQKRDELRGSVIISVLVALVLGLAIGIFIAVNVTRPIKRLAKAAKQVAAGDLTDEVKVRAVGEIHDLVDAFNIMLTNLKQLVEEIDSSTKDMSLAANSLSEGAEQTVKGTEEVSATSQQLTFGADEQVKQVDQVMAVVEEIAEAMQQMASSAVQVAANGKQTYGYVGQGQTKVEQMVVQMKAITSVVGQSAAKVRAMEERSQEIGKILGVITGIAEQTNLLALNAAIEAARAGDQGRGFAVVADEVRKLAEQSAQAANQISSLITEVQRETGEAVNAMLQGYQEVETGSKMATETGQVFSEIASSIKEFNIQVQEMATSSEQVAAGGNTIVKSVSDISKVAKQVSDGAEGMASIAEEQTSAMEEVTASANQLAHLANKLKELTAKFKV
ncbi:MAG: methyl-accepting chemotaxis protein [Bacillota bacterium]|nr:methyl-accepting chemotaxis protein [Bacillota bacterium]